jgi:serine/threonine protein kinase/Tfp pilus assembly protein PilF
MTMEPNPPQDRTVDARAGGAADGTTMPPTPAASAEGPQQIGPYRLLSVIGEGGFGTVWLAERRDPFVQRVALKVIKPGMDSRAVLARFEQERQALAMMQHPGIARVLDGGLTPEGRPFFVMEFVKGLPITEFCDGRRLSIRQRLGLFRLVCDAVQHAHLKGIVHRDLKPGNILAFDVEGQAPGVKVIDFGVAKATAVTSAQSVFTESGQMVGTPEYMSPEQAEARAAEIDTRSDIYSLGVVLYELLTGVVPLDVRAMRDRGIREMQRYIAETDPPAPSLRLSTIADAELKSRILQSRQAGESELRKRLQSELEWIPLLAMRKEPQNRYQSAMDLARDIERYLSGQALQAGPPSLRYRLRKVIRRNRGWVAAGATVATSLVLGLGLALWQWRQAVDARREAERRALEATAISDFVVQSLASGDPMQGGQRDFTVKQAMAQAIDRLKDGMLREQPDTEAELKRTIALILEGNADLGTAETLAASAAESMRRLHGAWSTEHARCLDTLGTIRMAQGRYPEAETVYRQAVEIRERTLPGDDPRVGSGLNNLAEVCRFTGKMDEAAQLYERAIRIQEAVLGPDASTVAQAVNNLAILRVNQGRFTDAERLFQRALDARRRTLGPDHPKTASALSNLGGLHDVMEQPERARPLYEQALAIRIKALGERHPHVADSLNNLGSCERNLGRPREAADRFRQALAIWESTLGPDHPDVAIALENLADALRELGQRDEAQSLVTRAIEIHRRSGGPESLDTAPCLCLLAEIRLDAGDPAGARTLLLQAQSLQEKGLGPAHPDLARTLHLQAQALLRQDQPAEALPLQRRAIAITETSRGTEFAPLADALTTLAEIETALGHGDQAARARERAEAIRRGAARPAVNR